MIKVRLSVQGKMDQKAQLKFGSSSIQLSNEFDTILLSSGHALTIHDPLFFTIYCCSSVEYHNFVSSPISGSKVSFKIL